MNTRFVTRPIEQQYTLDKMADYRKDKLSDTHTEVVENMPSLNSLPAGAWYLGSYTWSSPENKLRYMLLPAADDYGGGYASPADKARDYVQVRHGKERLRCNTRQWHAVIDGKRSSPLYATPIAMPEAVYVDLVSAYWSILKITGWKPDYMPGRYLALRDSVMDFPFPSERGSRNSLVTAFLPGKITTWKNGKLAMVSKASTLINKMLWSLVQDVLNGIAADMVRYAGAVYVYTDGYIVSAEYVDRAFDIIASWGLQASVRHHGVGVINGPGNYRVGTHRSGHFRDRPHYVNKIAPIEHVWLRHALRRAADIQASGVLA